MGVEGVAWLLSLVMSCAVHVKRDVGQRGRGRSSAARVDVSQPRQSAIDKVSSVTRRGETHRAAVCRRDFQRLGSEKERKASSGACGGAGCDIVARWLIPVLGRS